MIDLNRYRRPDPDDNYVVQTAPVPERRKCRSAVAIGNEVIEREPGPVITEYMRRLQYDLGGGLVAQIWEAGGMATVQLKASRRDDYEMHAMRYCLEADVQPAATMQPVVRMAAPHFEYFPADWVCDYCGQLNDGMKYPRTCVGCQAPKGVR